MLGESLYKSRLEQIQKQLETTGADFALLTPAANFQYITGYTCHMRERLVALVIPKGAEPELVVPAFEASDHSSHTWVKEIRSWTEDENPYLMIADAIGKGGNASTVMLDDSLPLGVYWSLEKAFGGFKKALSITPAIDALRISKSEDEVALMRKAGHIIDEAMMKAFREAQIGMTEVQVSQIVQEEILRQGAAPSFSAVLFGRNSALPHADSSSRELRRGDVVLMDCGCSTDGYNTDMTRVGVAGRPSPEMEQIYSIVRKAEETAIESICSGMVCGIADGIARRIIEAAGYGDYFTHRLGHGIGLEVHEPPYLVRGSSSVLGLGMCHSVEPGVYFEGKFGMRVEDLVCIHQDGLEVITYSPKELITMSL